MTPKERAAIQHALEALEEIHVGNMTPMAEENWNKAITALREALAEQAEQEPVAYLDNGTRFKVTLTDNDCYISGLPQELGGRWVALVAAENDCHLTAAPVRTKDLTVSELDAIIEKHYDDEMDLKAMILDGIAADREKNK